MAGHATITGMRQFFKENPQVLILLIITVVLGVGTFIAVIVGLAGAGTGQATGEPSGWLGASHAALSVNRG